MSTTDETGTTQASSSAGAHAAAPSAPTAEEIREMTPEEAMIAGAETDGIHIVHRRERFPIRGTKAEKRAERAVAACFAISGLAGVGFIVCFVALPYKWHLPGTPQNFRFYTPALGGLLAAHAAVHGLRPRPLGQVAHARGGGHPGPARRADDRGGQADDRGDASRSASTTPACRAARSSCARLALAGGALATVPLVALVGGMIKKPGDQLFHTLFEPNRRRCSPRPAAASRWSTPTGAWSARTTSSRARSRRCSPAFVRTTRTATTASRRLPPRRCIIRLRPGQKVVPRKGQAGFGWPSVNPEYVAFSKICTHAGCPASLYEQQTDAACSARATSRSSRCCEDAKPVFGPATRSLPKLPLDVVVGKDGKQYFVARSDYIEPIGPGFWERP